MLKNRIITIALTLLLASPLYVGPVEGADDSDAPKTRKRSNRGSSRDAAKGAHQRVKDEATAKKAREDHDKAHARNHPLFMGRDWKKSQKMIESGEVNRNELSFTELYDADLKYLACDIHSSHIKFDDFGPNHKIKKGKYGSKFSAGKVNGGKIKLIFPEKVWGADYRNDDALLEQHLYWDIQFDDVSFDYNGIIVLKSETPAKKTGHCRYEVDEDILDGVGVTDD